MGVIEPCTAQSLDPPSALELGDLSVPRMKQSDVGRLETQKRGKEER
jgi:hypothetical protein